MIEVNKAVVRRLFDEYLNRHNAALESELYADAVFRAPAVGELRGEAHRQFLLSVFSAFPDAHYSLDDQFAEGDKVASRWTFVGTHRGEFMGAAPTGKQVTLAGMTINRVVDGKIVEEWAQWDTLGLLQQLGAVPTAKVEEHIAA
jgi:steroid delta-isomerase-like uncharacterized protein